MKIEPKTRGFICTTAHPEGCRLHVKSQIDYVKAHPQTSGPKRALILGASTGYGLASRIVSAYSCGAATLGVIFDKPASGNRTATAGWYNTAAFEEFAHGDGLYAKTVNGDAFSREIKEKIVSLIREDLGTVDFVVYSLAAPRRTTADGVTYSSVLKTTGEEFTNSTIDLRTNRITQVTVPPATPEEVTATVKVMGGEDWEEWIETLSRAGVLAENAVTVAYSYLGPELTHPIYLNGSIGMAKKHLWETSRRITQRFPGVRGYISVNKALVTQASAAIPVVPLYISILYKVMKEKGIHEGCVEQMYRMFHDKLFSVPTFVDSEGRIRVDDWEMRVDVQKAVQEIWKKISDENVKEYTDLDGYWNDFYQMFGFRVPGVDYGADCDPEVKIPSIS